MKNLKTKLNQVRRSDGFTIIEVMIVLAVAGIILLIVLLAVPALQRNSRNTQATAAAGQLVGYANDYAANNNGSSPVGAFYDKPTGNVCMDLAAVTACASSSATGYIGRIQGGQTVNFTISTTGPTEPTSAGTFNVWVGGRCTGNTITGGTASGRAVSVGYVTETATGVTNQCQGS